MNPFSRLFCRGYQICFRLALPLLPYRQPELLTAVTDIPSLLREVEVCRTQGYAIENGEYKIGLRSISAPIYNVGGESAVHRGDHRHAAQYTLR